MSGKGPMNLRNLLALVILLSVAALAATLVLNLPDQKDAEDLLDALPKQVDLALEKVHYTQTEGGRRRWTLDADSAAYQREAGLANLKNVQMVFFDAGRFSEVRMTAKEGTFDQQQERVEIWGNVEIVTDSGEHFYTDRLRYDQASQLVSSDDPVRLVSPRLELSGTGLLLDIQVGQMTVLRDVRARIMEATDERSKQ